MITLHVTYALASELQQDLEAQLVHGGLLVKLPPPPGLQLHGPVRLIVTGPDGRSVEAEGQVLHISGDKAVAVSFPQERVPALRELLITPAAADAAGPQHEPTAADKIQLALHGTKDERTAILRDKNRMLHSYVLRNPQITPEEVLAIAKNPQSAPELLQQVAERKEWLQRQAIALALARNPKTPQGMGVRALDFVLSADLRQLAKGVGAPPHIVQAARKKVLR